MGQTIRVNESQQGVIPQTEKVAVNNPSTPYTPTKGNVVIWDCTTGNKVIELPQASLNPNAEINVKKIDTTLNTITVNTNGVETIDGQSSITLLSQFDSVTIFSNGVNWFII